MKLSSKKLLSNLKKINGTKIASIDTLTSVKLTGGKKNPFQGRVQKISKGANILLSCNMNSNTYENMVKKRLAKEGKNPTSFKLSPRRWGVRVPLFPIVLHNGNTYLEVNFLSSPKNVSYLLDGKHVDKSLIEGLPKSRPATQAGLNDKVVLRTFNIDNVIKFNCGELSV